MACIQATAINHLNYCDMPVIMQLFRPQVQLCGSIAHEGNYRSVPMVLDFPWETLLYFVGYSFQIGF